jgi:peptidoglycan/LPS O-acetylase OafA/YrhL
MQRNGTLDYARLIAAFGIVFFHTGGAGGAIGYAALPFFLMLLIVLSIPSARRLHFTAFAHQRAQRLLMPWIVWSCVYGALKLLEVFLHSKPLAAEFAPWMLLTGPAIHLWFLPFAFVACLGIYPLARLRPRCVLPTQALLILTLVAAALVTMVGLDETKLPVPLMQWSFGVPAVFLGLALAFGFEVPSGQFVAMVGAVFAGLTAYSFGWTGGLLQLALATVALLVCLNLHYPETPKSRWAAQASLGVYLSHPLIASILMRTTPLPENSTVFALTTIAGSLALTAALHILFNRPRQA